jgi:hypothetical protein
MMKPREKGAVMHTTIEIVRQNLPFCMDVVYFLQKFERTLENITVEIKSLDRQNFSNSFVIKKKQHDNVWTNRRITSATLLQTGKYNITVTFSSNKFFIGSIHFCTEGIRRILVILEISKNKIE